MTVEVLKEKKRGDKVKKIMNKVLDRIEKELTRLQMDSR